ncbi:MAG: cytochrome c [Phototrophicaceae bacterium]
MKYFITWIILLMGLSACTSGSDIDRFIATNPEAYETGQRVYAQNCASCHGEDGEGQFPNAPMQPDATGRIGAPPHDSSGHTWHHADSLLYQIVAEGGSGTPDRFYPMPAFGDQLTTEEIEAVLFYIKTFWTEEERQRQAEISDASGN